MFELWLGLEGPAVALFVVFGSKVVFGLFAGAKAFSLLKGKSGSISWRFD